MYMMTQELALHGYIPIIAHAERYRCIVEKPDAVNTLRELGAWIQLNADGILGLEGFAAKKFCKRLLMTDSVDVVASDSHDMDRRACRLGKCQQVLTEKYGEEYAGRLLFGNPWRIIADALEGAARQVNRRS
jgi:protein-tyrosine phosphatase